MISYKCCNDCEDRINAVCDQCNRKPHIAEFYTDKGSRRLNFDGEEFKVVDIEDDNGGKEVHCYNSLGEPALFFWKNGRISLMHIGGINR